MPTPVFDESLCCIIDTVLMDRKVRIRLVEKLQDQRLLAITERTVTLATGKREKLEIYFSPLATEDDSQSCLSIVNVVIFVSLIILIIFVILLLLGGKELTGACDVLRSCSLLYGIRKARLPRRSGAPRKSFPLESLCKQPVSKRDCSWRLAARSGSRSGGVQAKLARALTWCFDCDSKCGK